MSLSFDLDLVNYSSTDAIQDCINDQTEWINLTEEWKRNPKNRKYEHELKLLLDKYKGLPLVKIIVNENDLHLIENIGIKQCERYPDKKCAFIKPFFCKDKYSSTKDEHEILDSSFFGVLDHTFYETRRRNNPFARRSDSPNKNRTVRKNELPSSKYVRELVLGVPTMNTNVVYLPLEPYRKQDKNKINTLIRDMNKMGLYTRRSRSRLRDSTSSSRLRSTARDRSRSKNPIK